jgi:hypothetical protein
MNVLINNNNSTKNQCHEGHSPVVTSDEKDKANQDAANLERIFQEGGGLMSQEEQMELMMSLQGGKDNL